MADPPTNEKADIKMWVDFLKKEQKYGFFKKLFLSSKLETLFYIE